MSTDRETTRLVRSWLDEGVTALPARVLDAVIDQVPATPQRRSWWPAWRFADMNSLAKFAIAAAAVVVVAVVGINLLPRTDGNVGGAPAVSASPSPSPSPSPTASPSPSDAAFPPEGDLASGTYSMTRNGIRFSVTVPTSGWMSDQSFFLNKSVGTTPEGASLLFWDANPIGVFSDPCSRKKAPPAGATIADLAAAVSTLPGSDLVSGPTDVTVGGHPAKHVVLRVPEDAPCGLEGPNSAVLRGSSEFYLWYAPSDDRYISVLGATMRVWIIDVDGTIVWIDGETYKGAGSGPGQEIQQIIDSIQFE
jgi:hypothetical protein